MKLTDNKWTYSDPLTDFGFKRIFGSVLYKELLIAFLNGVFKGSRQIADLVFQQQNFRGKLKRKEGDL